MPLANVKISTERQNASAVYFADMLAVGAHFSQSVQDIGDWLEKPEGATHLMLQTIDANIRYTIDESPATLTHGFRLGPGAVSSPIPCPMRGISIFKEGNTTIQGQWVR